MRKHRWLFLLGVFFTLHTVLPTQPSLAVQDACASPSWEGSFYNDTTRASNAIHKICRRVIDFNWGIGAPLVGVNPDNFSTKWTSTQAFPMAGRYTFRVVVQGGAKLTVNNTVVINDLTADPDTLKILGGEMDISQASQPLPIILESVHGVGNAWIKLDWALISGGSAGAADDHRASMDLGLDQYSAGGGNVWWVDHYETSALDSSPKNPTRAPADGISVNYTGIQVSPATGSGASQWGTRWRRNVDFPAGKYTFYFRVDDVGRVLLDGQEIVSQTTPEGSVNPVEVEISAGRHEIVVEHAKLNNTSAIFLTWYPPIGTMLLPNGCNAVEVAGLMGNAALCAGTEIAAVNTFVPSSTLPNTSVSGVALPALVRAGPLNFRAEPATGGAPIQTLHRGENYQAIGRTADNQWVQLEVSELVGWSMAQYLTLQGDINTLPVTFGAGGATAPTTTNTTPPTGVTPLTVPPTTNTTPPTGSTTTVNGETIIVIPPAAGNPSLTTTPTNPMTTLLNTPTARATAQGNIKLRTGIGEDTPELADVAWGTEVSVIGRSADGTWILISLADGTKGWSVSQWYLFTQGTLETLPVLN